MLFAASVNPADSAWGVPDPQSPDPVQGTYAPSWRRQSRVEALAVIGALERGGEAKASSSSRTFRFASASDPHSRRGCCCLAASARNERTTGSTTSKSAQYRGQCKSLQQLELKESGPSEPCSRLCKAPHDLTRLLQRWDRMLRCCLHPCGAEVFGRKPIRPCQGFGPPDFPGVPRRDPCTCRCEVEWQTLPEGLLRRQKPSAWACCFLDRNWRDIKPALFDFLESESR